MLKLYWLMWYFTRPDRPREDPYKDEITRGHLWLHLAKDKKFREDWRITVFQRWLNYSFKKERPDSATTIFGMRMLSKQKEEIEDLIDKAIVKGYLIEEKKLNYKPEKIPSHRLLTTDWKGRDFLKPLSFLEACANEYPSLMNPLVSAVIALGVSLTVLFWNDLLKTIMQWL